MSKRKPRAKHTSKEDVRLMTKIVEELLLAHTITIRKRSSTATGRAYYDRSIRIPYPTNVEKFCVCLHEIGHHVNNGMDGENWEREYKAEMFALETAKSYGFNVCEYEVQAKRYVLVYMAESLRKGINTFCTNVKEFVSSEVDISLWVNKKPCFDEWGNRSHLPLEVYYV